MGAWSALGGPLVRLEAGSRLGSNAAVFAYGEASQALGPGLGVGVRWTW